MVYAPAPSPGPPGIATLEMPRHPHELSTMVTASSTRPCQARCRIARLSAGRFGLLLAATPLIARLSAGRFGLLLAATPLIARLTGPDLRQREPERRHSVPGPRPA